MENPITKDTGKEISPMQAVIIVIDPSTKNRKAGMPPNSKFDNICFFFFFFFFWPYEKPQSFGWDGMYGNGENGVKIASPLRLHCETL